MKTAGINREMAMDATNLTQLSSREQLSALMDGALPADETRFLLRRLQHDASLAECWERWRLSAEVMRGLAPAQRLPANFASRVAASLRGEDLGGERMAESTGKRAIRTPAWLRWGGGAAVAASLAVVALMTPPIAVESPGNLPGNAEVVAANTASTPANESLAVANSPASGKPASPPVRDPAGTGIESQAAALASVAVAAARPAGNARRGSRLPSMQAPPTVTAASDTQPVDVGVAVASNIQPLLPRTDIITRPWPRSVLPHDGNTGITVGFGDSTHNTVPYNPFQLRTGIGNLPPALIAESVGPDAAAPDNVETAPAANDDPQS